MAHKTKPCIGIVGFFTVANIAVIVAQTACAKGQFKSKFSRSCSDCPDSPRTSCKDEGDDAESCENSCIDSSIEGFRNATQALTRFLETTLTGFPNNTRTWKTTVAYASSNEDVDIFLYYILPPLCFLCIVVIARLIYQFLKKYQSNRRPGETALSIPLTISVNCPTTSVQQEHTQVDMTAGGTGSATEHNDQSQNPVGSTPPIIDKVNNNGELEGEHELNELLCAPNDEYTTYSV